MFRLSGSRWGGFTVNLMKVQLQGPSLAQAPSRSLGGALAMRQKCCEILLLVCERKLIEVFPNLTAVMRIYLTLPIMICESERNFSELSVIKNKFQSTMLDEKLHYISILSIENYIKLQNHCHMKRQSGVSGS